jgi:hypothetical protein
MIEREKLLRRVALKCADFARELSYHRALSIYAKDFKRSFWIYMYNNAIDLAVLDWFHLFDYHNDDLHWKRIIHGVDAFRNRLLKAVQMTEDEWKKYRNSIKDYRDKDVAHVEVRPTGHVPEMTVALRAAAHYYSVVLEELSTFRDYGGWPKQIEDYYIRSLEQTKTILSVAYQESRDIEEKVF